jgi:short-subunit dehydrogenase
VSAAARRLTGYEGVRAVVTGASSGIGRALSLRLAREGARLALVSRRSEALHEVAEEIRRRGGTAHPIPCDVADREQVRAAAERARSQLGGVDLLINNAGYGRHRRFLDWEVEDMERVMRVNYLGALYFTKALLPEMVEQRRGWLVFMASVAGRIATPEESAYAASKFALVGLAASLSMELEEAGVHVLTVCPGVIRTPFFDEEALARMPPVALRQMKDPSGLVEAILRALARGRDQLTYPRWIATGYWAGVLAPGFLRRQTMRRTMGASRRADSSGEGECTADRREPRS